MINYFLANGSNFIERKQKRKQYHDLSSLKQIIYQTNITYNHREKRFAWQKQN